jgi:O-antigen ligase
VAFIIVLAGIAPLSTWLRRNPDKTPFIWILVGFLPFVLDNLHLYIAIYSLPAWPGYVKGIEFSVLDALALAFYFSLPSSRQSLPFRFSMALYFLGTLLSVFHAEVPIPALFYPWQLARMFLLYAVISKACVDPRVAPSLLTGMAAALIMEAGFTVWQRFGLGILQASGTTDHQNTLGLMSHFVVFPLFALLLAGRRGWLPLVAVLAGVLIEVLTASRATLGLAGLGYAAVFVLSAMRHWTSRKALVLMVGLVAVAVVVPIALSSYAERGEAQMTSSDTERVSMAAASAAILADHPWGVGANNYVNAANVGDYYQKSGLSWTSFGAIVHNIYWLVAAETGYVGLITFVLFLFRPLVVAFLCGWRYRGDVRGDMQVGLGVALLIVYIHSGFEWIFITFEPQYLFALNLGLVAGLAQQLGYWRRKNLQGISLRAGAPSSVAETNKPAPL